MAPPRRIIEDFREGVAVVRTTRWYWVFLTAQLVFVPIAVNETFFALRTSLAHVDTAGSLHMIVVSSAAGLVTGSFLWRDVFSRFGFRGMPVSSAIISCVAEVLCAANELGTPEPHLWVYGVVCFLVVLSNAALAAATVSWISAFASDEQRPVLISFAATLAAVVTALLGAAFGLLAQVTAMWPVFLVLMLYVLAASVALRAPGKIRRPREHHGPVVRGTHRRSCRRPRRRLGLLLAGRPRHRSPPVVRFPAAAQPAAGRCISGG